MSKKIINICNLFTPVEDLTERTINSIGHDLRTPLTSIKGYAQLLRDAKDNEIKANSKYYCNLIHKNSERLHAAIANLIEILRYNENRGKTK